MKIEFKEGDRVGFRSDNTQGTVIEVVTEDPQGCVMEAPLYLVVWDNSEDHTRGVYVFEEDLHADVLGQ